MADLTADAPLRFRFPNQLQSDNYVLDNSAAQTVYKGQPVIIDASADTINVTGWTSSITLVTADDILIGVALEQQAAATADTEGDNVIQVITSGEVGFKSAVFTDANIGDEVGFDDSATLKAVVKAGAAGDCPLGVLTRVADGYAYVKIYPDSPLHMAF